MCRLCVVVSIRKFFLHFKEDKNIMSYCCSEKIAHSFFPYCKWCANTVKTLAWHNSETKCKLKMKFYPNAYFYKTLCLKINWNLNRPPLKLFCFLTIRCVKYMGKYMRVFGDAYFPRWGLKAENFSEFELFTTFQNLKLQDQILDCHRFKMIN